MKRKTYEQAFPIACELVRAEDMLKRATDDTEIARLQPIVQHLRNKIFPAAAQAASAVRSEIAHAALRWWQEHGGAINVTDFIGYCRKARMGYRHYRKSGTSQSMTDSSIRKIVARTLGVKGKKGRPSKA